MGSISVIKQNCKFMYWYRVSGVKCQVSGVTP
jgi:hypothetical protein